MRKYKLTILTFFLAIFIMLIICIILHISPFGTNTLMVWDMEWQYSSFLSWFRNIILGTADWKYSLNGGFGSNILGLIAYYLASPLNLILIFFNINNLTWGILILTLLKMGLIASTMQLYLYKKREDFYSVIFACIYAFSSYTICYQSNIMWLDSLILLPVVIYGIELLIEQKRGTLYGISLALSIITNYYMGYMICIFSVLYFITYLFIFNTKKTIVQKKNVFSVLSFLTYSLLGGGLSSFIVLPTIYNLKSSSNKHMLSINELLSLNPIFNPKDILPYFMAGSFNKYQGITGGIPLIYCGIFSLFLVCVFFTAKKVSLLVKTFYATLLTILFLSMLLQGPYLIWHGCYSPVGSPWRFSFIWTFLFITISYLSLDILQNISISNILPAAILIILFFSHIIFILEYRKVALLNLLIIILSSIIYVFYSSNIKKYFKFILILFSMTICIFEISYNAYTIHKVQFSSLYETQEEYTSHTTIVQSLLNDIEENNTTNLFRTEILPDVSRNYNDGYFYNIHSLNTYSSTEKQLTWDIFSNLGFGIPIYNSIFDNNVTTLSRSISGIKYLITSDSLSSKDYALINNNNDVSLYEYKNSLPFGFIVNESALNIGINIPKNLFEYQNDLYHALLNSSSKNIFSFSSNDPSDEYLSRIIQYEDNTYTDGSKIYIENTTILQNTIRELKNYTLSITSPRDSVIQGKFINPTSEIQYVCFTVPYEDSWTATVNSKSVNTFSGMGGFILVPISPGVHTIELVYTVPYLNLGLFISIICLFCIIIGYFLASFNSNKKLEVNFLLAGTHN